MDKQIIKKLKITSPDSLLIANAPSDFSIKLPDADMKIKRGKKYDFVLLFVNNKNNLERKASQILKRLNNDHHLWIAYPKKSATIKTDVNRNAGWDALVARGYEALSQVVLDKRWCALHFMKKEHKQNPSEANSNSLSFTATIEAPGHGGGAFISIPFNVEKTFGTKGHIKVKAWFDGYPYRGILANMGSGCHVIIIRKDIQKAIGKKPGDKIHVTLEHDLQERVVDVPEDLQQAFLKAPEAQKFYNSLSFTNRKEYAVWITSPKRQDTRDKHLAETIRKLLQGKKNPSVK